MCLSLLWPFHQVLLTQHPSALTSAVCEKMGPSPACLLDSQSLGYRALACEVGVAQICHLFFLPSTSYFFSLTPVSKAWSKVLFTICFLALRNSPAKFILGAAKKAQNKVTVHCPSQSCSISALSSCHGGLKVTHCKPPTHA